MSTNAVIRVEGQDNIEVYKHWDGYPDSTLPWLKDFNEDFKENRGDDPDYKLAQLLRSSARDAEEFDLDPSKHTGWAVVVAKSYGWEYRYTLNKDGTVIVEEDE
jgi:hypothetical protein